MTSSRFRPLVELCDLAIDSIDPRRAPEQEFWYVDITAVDNATKCITAPQRVKGKQSSVRARQVMRSRDVLVATTRPNLNAVALVPDLYNGEVCSTGFCLLRCSRQLDPDYLFCFVQSQAFIEPLTNLTKGALYPAVTDRQVLERVVPWVPVEEQCQIASHLKAQLAEAERARMAAEAQLQDAHALDTALYREAFMQIVPVAVPPVFGFPPSGWRWRKLADIAQLESGHTPSRSRPDWWGGNVSWVSLTEIRELDGTWVERTRLRTNEAGIANSSARMLPRGTVCFSRTASVGFVTILDSPMATSQDFANWVCGDELDPEYLMYALIRSRAELRAIATGATHKTIYMPALESFHVCAPDRPEQERIISALKKELKDVEQVRIALEQQLCDFKQLPNRLLAEVFGN